MSVPSPWSVKGVQPKAREAAKDLARREGLTLGEWLNRLIGDVDEDGQGAPARGGMGGTLSPQQNNSYQSMPQPNPTESRIQSQNVAAIFKGHSMSEPQAGAQNWPARDNDNSRLTAALEQLTRRLDLVSGAIPTSPTAPMPAPAPVYAPLPEPQSARFSDRLSADLSDRVEMAERRTESAIGRVDASLADVRQTQAALNERLRAIEANDPTNKSLAALRSLETALNRLSQQVYDVDARAEAIESKVDEKLANLGPDPALLARVDAVEGQARQSIEQLDERVNQIGEHLVAKASELDQTHSHVAQSLDNLSARIAHAEDSQDARLNLYDDRIIGIADVTTQAIESVDKGLGLVSERVAATEALAQATNERLVEALQDLSDRLGQLESIDTQEAARDLLSALEVKNKELARRLEALDQKIDTTRLELTQEVQSAVATGVDGQMAEIAKALADRLDASERRSGETLERIGAEMARASVSLDQRLRDLEERGTDDVAAAMRSEMAKMMQAIDERMATMTRRDSSAMAQAGGQFEQLARALSEKLDASEARAQSAVKTVSSQMEQLALRLQARQEESAQSFAARVEESRLKGQQELQDSLALISSEIRTAEERAKAATEPLRREVSAMIERLDHVEAKGLAPFSEALGYGDHAVTISDFDDAEQAYPAYNSDPASGRSRATVPDSYDVFAPDYAPAQERPDGAGARSRFGAAFPGGDADRAPELGGGSLLAQTPTFDAAFSNELVEDPLAYDTQHLGGQTGAARTDLSQGSGFDEFVDGLEEDWSEPARTNRGGQDYLMKARKAASRAATELEKAVPLPAKKKSFLRNGASQGAGQKGKARQPTRVGITSSVADIFDASKHEKPLLSPLGIAAAAALVVTTGLMGYNFFTKDKAQDEKPAALAPAPAPAPAPALRSTGDGTEAETSGELPAAMPSGTQEGEGAATTPRPAMNETPANAPTGGLSSQSRQFVAVEQEKARQAAARADQIAKRVKAPATPTKSISTGKPYAQKPGAGAGVPQVATSQNRGAKDLSAKPSTDPRTPAPRVAVAGQERNNSSAAGKKLYEQALARQQAGDAAGAFNLMRSAADTGDARAINRLAKMYERGEGVARDRNQARALTERAAARGSRQAMHNLGVYYAEGEGNQRDMNKAAENFRKAAVKGVTDSQFNLGAMAEQGLGTERSEREAYYWYAVASKAGDRDAAAKTRELAARLPPAERAAEDQRVSQFAPEPGGED